MKKVIILLICILLYSLEDFNISNIQKELLLIKDINISDRVNISKYRDFKSLNLFAFKKNYFMPFVYDKLAKNRKKVEAEFQLSIMIPFFRFKKSDFFFGYTMHAVWQVYDKKHSSPFRDTNHEPQLFTLIKTNYNFKNLNLNNIYLGIIHQSNGRDIPASRSWNRIEIGFNFKNLKNNHLKYSLHLWKRIDKKSEKSSPSNPEGDDNPDLTNYIGDGFIKVGYYNNGLIVELKHQNRLYYDINRGSTLIEAIIPSKINRHFKWYLRYFYGYGNSLIDYNVLSNRIGIGIYVGGEEF